ncbi:MAG: cytidine deaminase [Clostridia bacterium]|nr:cytidine deaminase [Clostridia bacterium]
MDNIDLINKAIEASKNAYTPYSHFNVGAAILTKSGKVFTGCNVECSSYGISLCAERTALVKAVSEGCKDFEKIAVVGGTNDEFVYTTPCGACRQFLADFNQNMDVIMGFLDKGELQHKDMMLKELLPETFEL